MIDAEKTEKEMKVLMTEKAAKVTAKKVKKKKKIKKKTEEHMHADSACRTMMTAAAAYSDTETSVNMMTS